jgi:hypothetical protein
MSTHSVPAASRTHVLSLIALLIREARRQRVSHADIEELLEPVWELFRQGKPIDAHGLLRDIASMELERGRACGASAAQETDEIRDAAE